MVRAQSRLGIHFDMADILNQPILSDLAAWVDDVGSHTGRLPRNMWALDEAIEEEGVL